MKYFKAILKIFLPLFFIAITMSYIVEEMAVGTFSQEILAKKISGRVLDAVIYDFEIDELSMMENDIRNSKEAEKITAKFINTIIGNIVYNQNVQIDIEAEIDSLLSHHIPQEISEEKSDTIKTYVTQYITSTEQQLEGNLLHSFGNDYLFILKAYSLFTHIYFRIIVILLCILDMAVLIFLEKMKIVSFAKICSLILLVFSLATLAIIKLLFHYIDQNLAGGWLQSINVNSLIVAAVIEAIISFVFICIEKSFKIKEI